jgi:hypothetical protein
MRLSRRDWLAAVVGSAARGGLASAAWTWTSTSRVARAQPAAAKVEPTALTERIARLIREYEEQGVHRTATAVDEQSAAWLMAQVKQAGLTPAREPFEIERVDVNQAALVAENRRVPGIPLFDGGFTDENGVRGRLGPLGSTAEIGLADLVPNQADGGPLGEARRKNQHRAIVCVTRGGRPGLSPSNADEFLQPFGPPVVQVSSETGEWLTALAQRTALVRVYAQVTRRRAPAYNVTTTLAGADRTLPPLIVMTPRSGWYSCASERGGGIVCWLELMRTLKQPALSRDVLFVASSGHELGHLGINAYIAERPDLVKRAVGWMHFGANIGAATDNGNTIQASDDRNESVLAREMEQAGLPITRRAPRGTVPGGEAEAVHRGGGRYVSVIGRSALFHNPDDRGPGAVDVAAVARFIDVFTSVARMLSSA